MPNGIAEHSTKEWLNQDPYYRFGSGSWWIGVCNACHQPMLVKDVGAKVFPTPQPGPVSEYAPEPMRTDLRGVGGGSERSVALGSEPFGSHFP
jgi:hypothetical protein